MKVAVVGVVVLFSLNLAEANATVSCASAESLANEEDTCNENAKYADAGEACLTQLEAVIQARTAATGAQLRTNEQRATGGGRTRQGGTLAGATGGYDIGVEALDQLLREARTARGSVDSYLDNIIFPEEFDAPAEVIGDGEEFLNNSQCYSEPRDLVQGMVDTIDEHIQNLERARQTAQNLGTTSGGRATNLDSVTPAPRAARPTPSAAGRPAPRRGAQPKQASDITGTKPEHH